MSPSTTADVPLLVQVHKQFYELGRISASLAPIQEAHSLAPNDPYVVYRYVTVLLRYGHHAEAREILGPAQTHDWTRLALAELFYRQEQYDQAIKTLETIQDKGMYNYAYYLGASRMFRHRFSRSPQDLRTASAVLTNARAQFPKAWWIGTDLAVLKRYQGRPDTELEQKTVEQIEMSIDARPFKASTRLHRLMLYVVQEQYKELEQRVKADIQNCSKEMEVAIDMASTVDHRAAMLVADEQRTYVRQRIDKWTNNFIALT